jgi:hypothetical protein
MRFVRALRGRANLISARLPLPYGFLWWANPNAIATLRL